MGWGGSVLFSFAWVFSRCDQSGVFYCPSHAYIPASVASFSHVFEGRDWSRLDDGRCPHDVDVLRCLYIPPLSTPQARSLRMQIILYCYRRFDRYICIKWEAESASRRSHCIWVFLGWWLVKLIIRRCFTQRWVRFMVEGVHLM